MFINISPIDNLSLLVDIQMIKKKKNLGLQLIYSVVLVSGWRRALQPTPVFLPEESQGQRSLAGYSP